jgi:integrase
MSVFKDKRYPGQWMVRFMVAGKWHQKRGFKTRQEGARWEAEERKRIDAPPEGASSTSFASLAEEYLTHCQARFQKNTWRSKGTYYARFIGWLGGDVPVEQITRKLTNDYLLHVAGDEGNKNANRHLKDLSALFAWAVRHEIVPRNPCVGIERFPEDPFVKYVPPARDIEAVILAADPDETDLLEFLYYTGARIGEVCSATWEAVNFEREDITLWTRKRRGGELQADKMALSPALGKTLRARWKRSGSAGGLIFDINLYQRRVLLGHLCDRAGVRQFGYHAIRHHVASILADSGKATLRQIQQFLRHRRPTTTEAYLHDVTRDQREVVEILEKGRANDGS